MHPYEKVDIVYLDAHPDFRDERFGSKYSHGSTVHRLFELPNVGNITVLGLHVVDRVAFEDMKRLGVRWATTTQILEEGPAAVVERLVPTAKYLYVSIDIDIMDISLVPGTTLPRAGRALLPRAPGAPGCDRSQGDRGGVRHGRAERAPRLGRHDGSDRCLDDGALLERHRPCAE